MSYLSALQTDLTAAIAALGLGVTIESAWVPNKQREKLTNRLLIITPAKRSSTRAARGCVTREVQFAVIQLEPATDIDANAEEQQDNIDKLETIYAVGDWRLTKIEQAEILSHEMYRESSIIRSITLMTFQITLPQ